MAMSGMTRANAHEARERQKSAERRMAGQGNALNQPSTAFYVSVQGEHVRIWNDPDVMG